jgi:hypothetical protein
MCYSFQMSLSLAIAGVVLTGIACNDADARKQYLHVIYGFYTLMEILQTIQYMYVNDCTSWQNSLLTNIAYVLVIVQPLLWNTIFYYRVSDPKDKQIFKLAIVLHIVWMSMNVLSRVLYTSKDDQNNNCGFFNNTKTCTYRKNDSHLYWTWTTKHMPDMTANIFMYLCIWFVPALMVTHTRFASYCLIIAVIIGMIITKLYGTTMLEFPSTWCLISIPMLMFGYLTFLYTKI